MSDLAFSAGDSLIESGQDREGVLHSLEEAVNFAALVKAVPWARPIFDMQASSKPGQVLQGFASSRFKKRMAQGPHGQDPDLFRYLLEEDDESGTKLPAGVLAKESILAIIAGADTTRNVATCLIAHLLRAPSHYQKLVTALRQQYSQSDITADLLAKDALLNAYINETLRYDSPVAVLVQRTVPAGGAALSGYFVSEGTNVRVLAHAVHRSPKVYEDPDSFKPERWLHEDGRADSGDPSKFLPCERFAPFV